MGIKASDDLFQLIQAMSAADKRAFRLLSERHARQDGNNYLQLFDAIAAQTQHDEAQLRQQFAGKPFLRNFSEAKAYLYRSLLRSMRFSRGPESPETELREVLDHLELLFDKGLYEQAERQVRFGLEKASQLDLHAFTSEFTRWQRRLAKIRGGKHLLVALAQIGTAESAALTHLSIEAQLHDLTGRIQTIFAQKADLASASLRAALEEIFKHPALQAPPSAAGFHALSAYYYAYAYYHGAYGNVMAAMEAWERVVATYEAHPVQIKRNPDQYINVLVSLIDSQLSNRTLADVPHGLERMRQLKAKEPHTIARLFFLEQHLAFRYALVTGHLSVALQRVPELELGMVKYAKFLSASLELTMLYNLCALFFLAERYPEAQRYVNQALNRPHLPIREDIIDAIYLLEMIARYARGQTDVLEHLHRAQERRLRTRESQHPFSQMANRFIGKLLTAVDAPETRACIAEAQSEMQTVASYGKPTGFEELRYWLRGRSENKRIEEVLQSDMPMG
jgi:hypothetical protein